MRRTATVLAALVSMAGIAAASPPLQAPTQTVSPPLAAPIQWTGSVSQGGLITGQVPQRTTALTLDGAPIRFAADGRFIIGFDRDAKPQAMLRATLVDGREVDALLHIAPRQWDVSRLSTLPKYPVPEPEFTAVRPAELARIAAARATPTDAVGWRQHLQWPTTGRISTRFGSQRIYRNGEAGAYHSGTDIARGTGTIVVAPADGVVVLAADHPFTLEGNLLMIDHGMGLGSAFLHLSRIDVAVGDHVRQGQPVGAVGMTGRATGPHLHWSLRWRDAKLDPELVAGPMGS